MEHIGSTLQRSATECLRNDFVSPPERSGFTPLIRALCTGLMWRSVTQTLIRCESYSALIAIRYSVTGTLEPKSECFQSCQHDSIKKAWFIGSGFSSMPITASVNIENFLKPRPNALDISLDNARHFVEANVESVWPPCRVLLRQIWTSSKLSRGNARPGADRDILNILNWECQIFPVWLFQL